MSDNQKTKAELLQELSSLRSHASELEKGLAGRQRGGKTVVALEHSAAENPNPVLRISKNGMILYANKASAAVLQTWQRQVGQRLPEAYRKRAQQALKSGRVSTFEFECDDGRIFLVTLAPAVKDGYLNAYGVDITERKKAEEALRESEQKWRSLAENAPDVILTVDPDGTILFLNHTVPPFTPEKAIGTSVYDYVPPEHQATLRDAIEQVVRTGQPCSYEIAGMGPGRRTSWYQSRLGPIKHGGKVVALTLIAADVTEHKQAEDALRIKDSAIRSSINAVAFADLQGNLTYVNDSFLTMWGYDHDRQVLGRPAVEFWQSRDHALHVLETVRDKGSWLGELIAQRTDGSVFSVQLSVNVVADDNGRPICLMGSFVDVSEQKDAEEKLHKTQTEYRALVERVPAITYTAELDEASTTIYISPQVEQILGLSPLDYETDPDFWRERLHPEDRERVLAELAECHKTQQPFICEYRMIAKDGRTVWFRDHARVIKDEKGDPQALHGVMLDITERKHAEEALRESELLYRTLFETLPVGVGLATLDGRVIDANSAMLQMTGRSEAEMKQTNLREIYQNPEDRGRLLKQLQRDGLVRDFETPLKRKDGTTYCASLSIAPLELHGREVLLTVARDVTAYKQAQEKLIENERILRSLVNAITESVLLMDPEGLVLAINESAARRLGFRVDELIGNCIYDFLPDHVAESRKLQVAKVVRTGQPVQFEDCSLGRHICHSVSPVLDSSGRVTRLAIFALDMTERKHFERELADSEEKYRTLVESAGETIATVDEAGVFLFINEIGADRLGGEAADYIGKTMWDIFPKDIADRQMSRIREAINTGKGTNTTALTELLGRRRWYSTTIQPMKDKNGRAASAMIIARDVHDLKIAQDQVDMYRDKMAQTERLVSLGTLSATMAHELTQPLTTIRLSIENSLAELQTTPCPSDVVHGLEDSLDAVVHAVSIVDRFRNFARQSAEKTVSEIELHAVAERIVRLLHRNAEQANLSVRLKDLEKLPPIYVHEKDTEQLFFALVENAIQAAGGRKEHHLTISGAVKKEHVELQFADTCGGIAPRNLDKVFKPFFTTKRDAERTGLGLCVVQRIVSRAGGKVWVESEPGKGTTFFVTLPVLKTGKL